MDKDVHILVVEDDEDINKLLCKIIRTSPDTDDIDYWIYSIPRIK